MQYSDKGIKFTEKSEALRTTAYQDQGGRWTIGYGHTGSDVHAGMTIDAEKAEELLIQDTLKAANAVSKYVRVTLTQGEFDALVDFVFNVGATAFATSKMLKLLNSGDFKNADSQFLRWVYVKGQPNKGLLNRRVGEQKMFEGE